MESQYVGHVITLIAMLAGLAGVYARISARLTRIETCLEIADRTAPERRQLARAEAHDVARAEVARHESECPSREPTGVRSMPDA